MPAESSSSEDGTGTNAVKLIHANLDRLQDETDASDSDIDFLSNFLSSPLLQTLVETHDILEDQPEDHGEIPSASRAVEDVRNILKNQMGTNNDAVKLDKILCDIYFRSLVKAHDDIADKHFEEENMMMRSEPMMSPPPVFDSISDQIRLVGIIKSETEPLGMTVKIDDTGELVIARIMAGSMSDKLGLLHVGDVIKEVNGIPVFTPQHLMDIIRNTDKGITLKIIPAYTEQSNKTQMYMKAHFSYDPMKDRLIPCKEAGLPFKDGDVLQILSGDDSNWWQAKIATDELNRVGLIPSQRLEENRKAFVRADMDYSTSSFLCGLKRKKKKKIKYNAKNNKEFDKCELSIYEEVAKMPPFQRKTLVLVGANGVGRRSLKERLIKSDPRTFASGLPHTSRPPREGEENGKSYYFVDRETIELGIKNDEFLEYGEFNGNLYGTKIESIQNVIRSGKMCVLDVNATSLRRLKNAEFMPYIIFIAAPSAEALRVMWEDGRRKGKGRGIAGPGTMELKTEDDFLRTVEESEQIEKTYKSYFDLTIVNDNFEDSFFQIRKALDELSTDTQWVPVTWVY
ncbi:hypothetical protein ACJMK2_013240 [Sinanodonta woodiana]|uniref:MAGUK p55 subfamily member 6 n=1 Tax=Sinanodonta woodiana TaxID=1069815 RepID=A0ABD3UY68_SINWO